MERGEIENDLRIRNKPFQQTCCSTIARGDSKSWDDLVQVGKEDAPWYCSENYVYVAFKFEDFSVDSEPLRNPKDTDRLQSIALYRRLEGCL
jgi:hypothetical protein